MLHVQLAALEVSTTTTGEERVPREKGIEPLVEQEAQCCLEFHAKGRVATTALQSRRKPTRAGLAHRLPDRPSLRPTSDTKGIAVRLPINSAPCTANGTSHFPACDRGQQWPCTDWTDNSLTAKDTASKSFRLETEIGNLDLIQMLHLSPDSKVIGQQCTRKLANS